MTGYDLKTIALAGANLIVDAKEYSAYDLKNVAASLFENATLTIKGASQFSAYDLKTIASAAPGKVCFDFS